LARWIFILHKFDILSECPQGNRYCYIFVQTVKGNSLPRLRGVSLLGQYDWPADDILREIYFIFSCLILLRDKTTQSIFRFPFRLDATRELYILRLRDYNPSESRYHKRIGHGIVATAALAENDWIFVLSHIQRRKKYNNGEDNWNTCSSFHL